MDLGLKNKNVLIVGASKGIGRETALAFARERSRVTVVARSESLLMDLVAELSEITKHDHKYYVKDLMNCDIKSFAESIQKERGIFDVVIHNIGGSLTSRDPFGNFDEWMFALKFNAGIAIEFNHIFLPAMIEKAWGRIIHVSSISAKMLRGNPQYASAKAFLNAYVETTGRSVASTGVIMSAIMPGAISFPGSYWDKTIKTNPDKCKEFLKEHQAVGRFGRTNEISNIIVFMASEQASFMQSSIVPVDGANM